MLNKVASGIGKFCYRHKYAICVVFVVLFIAVCFLQSKADISYSYSEYNKVTDVFPEDDTLVIVYNNEDEDAITSLLEYLGNDVHVTSIQSYANTLGMPMSGTELSQATGMDELFVNTVLYVQEYGTNVENMTLVAFINFLASDEVMNSSLFSSMDAETKAAVAQLAVMINGVANNTLYSSAELSAAFSIDQAVTEQILQASGTDRMTLQNFLSALLQIAESQPALFTQEQEMQLKSMEELFNSVSTNQELSPSELAEILPVDSETFNADSVELIYLMYYGDTSNLNGIKISVYDFIFICDELVTNEKFASVFTDAMITSLNEAKLEIENGKEQLVGADYSRIILTISYAIESPEIAEFYDELSAQMDLIFKEDYYFVGNSAMSNELSKTFETEYLIISLIIVLAIFAVICITFRKFSIPALLTCIIQCAVFTTMSAMALMDVSMYFIALIIVQSILMGSMVDYGILLTSYYREVRREYPKETALPEALRRSISAILTSGLIMVTVCFILGAGMSGAVGSILTTLGIGVSSALILVLFVLPSLLSILDKYVVNDNKTKTT